MSEVIMSINEVDNQKIALEKYGTFAGFIITTTKQQIKLLIEDEQSCYEQFGYFMSNDNLAEFIGATLNEIKLVDQGLNVTKLEEHDLVQEDTWETPAIMFVNLETDKGTLQFTAYNIHNGYYGHAAYVIAEQLNHTETL